MPIAGVSDTAMSRLLHGREFVATLNSNMNNRRLRDTVVSHITIMARSYLLCRRQRLERRAIITGIVEHHALGW